MLITLRFCSCPGGKLLEELKRLFDNLKALELLKLNNLLLELADAPGVLDCIVKNCGSSLQHLEIRNYTKVCTI